MTPHRLIACIVAAVVAISSFRAAADSGSAATGATWTLLNPSVDSRVIYVSSTGSDFNTGLSPTSPLRTLDAGYAKMRDGYPDWMLLKCGDVWTNARLFWNKNGRSESEPMVLGSYGSGSRPRLESGAGTAFTSAMANLAIVGLHLRPAPGVIISDSVMPSGIEMITGMQPMGNILIEDCRIEGYLKGIVVDLFQGDAPFNYKIRRNVIVDCYNTGGAHCAGMYAAGIRGLLVEGNVFDHNGWREDIPGAIPNMFRRNLYVQSNCSGVVIRGNIFARSAAEGFQLRCGGLVEDNLCLRNGVSSMFIAEAGMVRNNVILDSRDLSSTEPRACGIDASQLSSGAVAGNICAYRTTPASAMGFLGISCASHTSVGAVSCHDNLVYDWEWGPSAGCAYLIGPTVSFYNNAAVQPQGATLVDCWDAPNPNLRDNRYWSPGEVPFYLEATGQSLTWTQWRSWSGEVGSVNTPLSQPPSTPTIGAYAASQGVPPSLESFLALCRQQSRETWRDAFTGKATCDYFRAGFGRPAVAACPGDFNSDGQVSVQDVMSFWNYFSAGNAQADLNRDGLLNVGDMQAMQQRLATGCP